MVLGMDNGVNNAEQDKSLLIYYIVVAMAAILVLIWYFFIYPNRNPAKPPAVRIAPSREILNSYSAPSTIVSKKVPDAVAKKYNAPKSAEPVKPPPQNVINSFSAASEL